MNYSISFKDALYLIHTYIIAENHPLASHPELLAVITHWLQSTNSAPIYSDEDTAEKWRRLLIAHLVAKRDKDWDGEPLRPRKQPSELIITFDDISLPPRARPRFTFGEFFAGIGGFRIPLQRLGGQCVFSSEWDDAARQTYFRNYGEYPFGDIRQFTGDGITDDELDLIIPDHDVMAAGFPCQPFSLAGISARKHLGQDVGFNCEDQGTLFFDLVRIIRVKQPKAIILENVKSLVTHDDGKTFETIKTTIKEELGYSFDHDVIDASSVVPQRRERCYMVCFQQEDTSFTFPRFKDESLPLKSILEENPDDRYTISDKLWKGHKNRSKRNRDKKSGFVAVTADPEKPANTLIARYGKDGKECLILQDGKNPRKLTTRETARLQGFPEEFVVPESLVTAYKQFGNTVAVPVVEKIAKKVILKLTANGNGNNHD